MFSLALIKGLWTKKEKRKKNEITHDKTSG